MFGPMEKKIHKYDVGVIHGRFQVLHKEHVSYLQGGKGFCRHLVVGITNPDPMMIRDEYTDPNRSSLLANPLTYYERYLQVRAVLEEAGIPSHEVSIVPFPINTPKRYRFYVPLNAAFLLGIFDAWDRQKLAYFKSLNLKTFIMWDVPESEKSLSSTDVRRLMIKGKEWEQFVPVSVAYLMNEWRVPERLRKLRRLMAEKRRPAGGSK
jgi:nicotinamide-nucleotide adenylyltransferase